MKIYDFARPVFDQEEKDAVNRVMDGVWLASGNENAEFEREFAEYFGVPYALCVNSGSSANLLAMASLGLPIGSRVVTSACGFPATLSPILHCGLVPVFVDYDIDTYNIDVEQTVEAMREPGVRAVILAHTMGSPVDLGPIMEEAHDRDIHVIEDCCEAIGAWYRGNPVGSIGSIGTYSFYPSHQITALGGGGMVVFQDKAHYDRAKSMRDWGKMSNWDAYGQNDTAYDTPVDGIPYFKHYAYETIGYNMKLPEANAAFGRVQLDRLERFVDFRERNHDLLKESIAAYGVPIVLRHLFPDGSAPSWFGVVMRVAQDRNGFGDYLERNGVKHRPFFAGNILRHPPFNSWRDGAFPVADALMREAMFVGCHPGLTRDDISEMAHIIAGYWK